MNKSKFKKDHECTTLSSYRVSDRGPSDQCDQDSGLL